MKNLAVLLILSMNLPGAMASISRAPMTEFEQAVSAAIKVYQQYPTQVIEDLENGKKHYACGGVTILAMALATCQKHADQAQSEDFWLLRNFTHKSSVKAIDTLVSYCSDKDLEMVSDEQALSAARLLANSKLFEGMPRPGGIN